ncbi:hypothetical protein LGQ02_17150 [Bacillus shivajii]|uniref:hypothetical protein n=1 Tax=Bacillus shivajii TaxID=1983719 RepID=UPI001CFBDACA|nr:hypothetical protein [Bacillus shivajii]UCZ52526.1 hypothetical protein LGQ02_17150 [Bacillus shivajii]
MSGITKVRLLFALFLIGGAASFIIFQKSIPTTYTIKEYEMKGYYYDVVEAVEPLFSNHRKKDGKFYNDKLHETEKVISYLSPYMTEGAVDKVIEELFDEGDPLLYNEDLQEYLRSTSQHLIQGEGNQSFYSTVQPSLLNPGLKLISNEDLDVKVNSEEVLIEVNEVSVRFYNHLNTEQPRNYYEMYGYPPEEKFTVKFSFIEEEGQLLLDNYLIEVKDGVS